MENLDAVPYHLLPNFLHASLSLKPSFTNLFSRLVSEQLGGHPSFCVIADMFFPWCVDVARHYGVFSSIFCSGGGFGFACYHSLWLNLPHRSVDSDQIITLPDFPEASTTIHITQMSDYLREADGKNKVSEFNRKALAEWSKANGILFNTVEDLDRTGLNYFRHIFQKPIWAIGPINLPLTTRKLEAAGGRMTSSDQSCMKWLDTKPIKSILYVSFGLQNTISASQMKEIALALESSGKNFIRVIHPPIGFDINSEFRAKEWLLDGFEERICKQSKRGYLVHKWAP